VTEGRRQGDQAREMDSTNDFDTSKLWSLTRDLSPIEQNFRIFQNLQNWNMGGIGDCLLSEIKNQ